MNSRENLRVQLKAAIAALVLTLNPSLTRAGPDTTVDIYKQWSYQCQFSEDGSTAASTKLCELSHQLRDENNQGVLSVAFSAVSAADSDNGQPGIRATIVTPVGVDLRISPALVVNVSQQLPSVWDARYLTCVDVGCFSDFIFTRDDVALFKTGTSILVSFGMLNPTRTIELELPVNGLAEAIGVLSDDAF
jgi:invasion protein IalB